MAKAGAVMKAVQLETRPPVKGGEIGGRVSGAACPAVRRAMTGQEGRARGEAGRSCRVGRQANEPCSAIAAGRWFREDVPVGERARHRTARERKWCLALLTSNAKTP